MTFSRVDFPAPLVPIIPSMSPFSSENETSFTARNSSARYWWVSFFMTNSFSPMLRRSPVMYFTDTFLTSIILPINAPVRCSTGTCSSSSYR